MFVWLWLVHSFIRSFQPVRMVYNNVYGHCTYRMFAVTDSLPSDAAGDWSKSWRYATEVSFCTMIHTKVFWVLFGLTAIISDKGTTGFFWWFRSLPMYVQYNVMLNRILHEQWRRLPQRHCVFYEFCDIWYHRAMDNGEYCWINTLHNHSDACNNRKAIPYNFISPVRLFPWIHRPLFTADAFYSLGYYVFNGHVIKRDTLERPTIRWKTTWSIVRL